METKKSFSFGSMIGLFINLAIGFALYFLVGVIQRAGSILDYNQIVQTVTSNVSSKTLWFFMNFTEPQFYASLFASSFLILGGIVAWILDRKNSKYAGFPISYSSNMFPWVLASQVLSLFLTIFVFNFTRFFGAEVTWLPTFVTVVGIAPALMLTYGPGMAKLITVSVLAALTCFPVAQLLGQTIIPVLNVPGAVGNVSTMAITGLIICAIAKALPWMKHTKASPVERTNRLPDNIGSPLWAVRRLFADLTEVQYYGSEVAGLFLLIGIIVDCVINVNHPAYGSGVVPAIILSQFVASGFGIFLYTQKYKDLGWYATFVPVVSAAPGCVIMFGGTIPVALVAGVLSAIIGAPLAELLNSKLPEDYHIMIGNVSSMAITTIVVSAVIRFLMF